MNKLRASALLFFILILGIMFINAAEITGTIGPDENTQSGFTGDSGPEGENLLTNGTACDTNSQCNSGHCASDYDGVGKWCAAVNYCVHNGTITYSNGSTLCSNASTQQTCTNGTWIATICTGSCTGGKCVAATPTPTPSAPPSGGQQQGPGGGAAPGASPSPSPSATATPSPTPTPEEETVLETSKTGTVTAGDVDKVLDEAGVTDPEEKKKAQVATGLEYKKEMKVVKKTDPETGEVTYESQFTITVRNPTDKKLTNFCVIQRIPPETGATAETFSSPYEYSILSEEPLIVQWCIGELGPHESVKIKFTIMEQLTEEEFDLFSAIGTGIEEEVIVVGKGNVKVTLYDSETGAVLAVPVNVKIFSEDGELAAEKIAAQGSVEFLALSPGNYWIETEKTEEYEAGESSTFKVKADETAEVSISLEPVEEVIIPPEADLSGLMWLIIIVAVLGLLYYFRKPILGMFAAKPAARKAKTPLEEAAEEAEKAAPAAPAVEAEKPAKPPKKKKKKKRKKRKKRKKKKKKKPKKEEKPAEPAPVIGGEGTEFGE